MIKLTSLSFFLFIFLFANSCYQKAKTNISTEKNNLETSNAILNVTSTSTECDISNITLKRAIPEVINGELRHRVISYDVTLKPGQSTALSVPMDTFEGVYFDCGCLNGNKFQRARGWQFPFISYTRISIRIDCGKIPNLNMNNNTIDWQRN